MGTKTIVSIVGARPQFIKAAPVSRALASSFREVMIHTGQHYDYGMSDVFFEEMEIKKPDYNLDLGGGTHGEQTGRMLIKLEKILDSVQPDCVLVYGDTNSTLAGALAAAKVGISLAHVEAGLRSYNRAMPEEINRVLTDHVSTLLFCPTNAAVENLAKEGIIKGVHLVGDVMYDALLHNLELAHGKSKILKRLGLKKSEYALATVHRVANTDDKDRMSSLLDAFGGLSSQVVFPIHPRARKMMQAWGLSVKPNVSLMEPLGHFDMLALQ
ncbi:MAG: non-hydrolyzing UDP-N-acetylglucosamine 2-epimerase, partial [Armatimonadota bacterium]